jgi:hypothetical protein
MLYVRNENIGIIRSAVVIIYIVFSDNSFHIVQ